MKEKQYLHKLTPFDEWEIGAYESWLSNQAKEGWILEKVGLMFLKFKKSEAQVMEYRVVIEGKEKIENLPKEGWTLLEKSKTKSIYTAPQSETLEELYDHQKVYKEHIGQLAKQSKYLFIAYLVLLIVVAVAAIRMTFYQVPLLTLLKTTTATFMLVFVVLANCFNFGRRYRGMQKLKGELEQGVNHHQDWTGQKKRYQFVTGCSFIGSLVLMVILLGMLFGMKSFNLPKDMGSLPFIRVEEVTGIPFKQDVDDEKAQGGVWPKGYVAWTNSYNTYWNPLVKKYYESREFQDQAWAQCEYYELEFKALVPELVKELLLKHNESIHEPTKLEVDSLDVVYELEAGVRIKLIGVKENRVLVIEFDGLGNHKDEQEKEKILELMKSKLNTLY